MTPDELLKVFGCILIAVFLIIVFALVIGITTDEAPTNETKEKLEETSDTGNTIFVILGFGAGGLGIVFLVYGYLKSNGYL